MTLWVFGSINTDLVTTTARFAQPGETLIATGFSEYSGGKGANQAVALARLGAAPRLVGLLGDDAYGRRYRDVFAAEGVEARHVGEAPGVRSGVAVIEVAGSGENRILVVPGANGCVTPEVLEPAMAEVAAGDLALLQLEWPLATVFHAIRHLRAKGATVILDPAPAVELPSDLLAQIDFLTPNEHEVTLLAGNPDPFAAARALIGAGVKTVVLKLGARGSCVVTTTGEQPLAPYRVKAVDTTAAGDAFNAGFAVGLSRGLSVTESADLGNAVAALSTTAPGAQAAMPTWQALVAWKAGAELVGR